MAHVLQRSTWIPRHVDEVFAFFADIGNLQRITPPELRFRLVTQPPVEMHQGALIEFRLALWGVPFAWRTEISHWEPPLRFVDRQLAGPYAQWIHLHEFTVEGDGTRMLDRVDYRLPLGSPGRLGLPLVRRQLERIFDFREVTIQRLLAPAQD